MLRHTYTDVSRGMFGRCAEVHRCTRADIRTTKRTQRGRPSWHTLGVTTSRQLHRRGKGSRYLGERARGGLSTRVGFALRSGARYTPSETEPNEKVRSSGIRQNKRTHPGYRGPELFYPPVAEVRRRPEADSLPSTVAGNQQTQHRSLGEKRPIDRPVTYTDIRATPA